MRFTCQSGSMMYTPVVGEVEPDGDAWPELLEGVRLLKKTGNHNNGWSYLNRLAVSCPNPEHVQYSPSSVALRMDVPLWECLVAGSMVGGNGAQGILARHWQSANARSRGWTLVNSLACFFHRHFLWSLGNSTLEGKPLCVKVFLLFQLAKLQMSWY